MVTYCESFSKSLHKIGDMILIFYFSFFNFLALSKENNTSDELKQKDYEANNNLSPHQNSDIQEKSPSKPLISLNQVQKTINFDTGLISESKIINYDKDLKIRKEKSINPEFEATKSQPELLAESNQDYSNGIYENFQGPIYLNDNNPYTEIANSQFIDYQLSDDQYLFIVRKGFTFDHVKFIFNETVTSKYGAIKIECQSEVFIQNCKFIRCSGQNTIYFAPSTMPSKILSERNSIKTLIENCTFFQCIDENSNGFSVYVEIEADELQIFNCTFNNCGGGIRITLFLSAAIIEECKFFDCINNKVLDRAVVEIGNDNCIFTKNIVKFSSNENLNSICGLWIRRHGDIVVTNNYFYRIRCNENQRSSINIQDYNNDGNDDKVVVFNYNVIEDVGNVYLGTFSIKKKYDFNFDHNIIKNCKINDYSCSIDVGNSIKYSHEYQLTNLSLIGCSSNSRTGGGFGIWLVFNMRQGIYIIKDCLFENDHSGPSREGNGIYGGCGGGFHCGNTSISNTFVVIDNCTFKNNSAEYYGGAISLQSFPENEIKNCVFINNFAPLGGGAIHLSTDYSFYRESPMERCTITGCTFISNVDSNNCGNAIYFFSDIMDIETVLTIDLCLFTKNGNTEDGNIYSIVSDAPYLICKNSIFESTSNSHLASGIRIEADTKTALIEKCQFLNNYGFSSIDIRVNSSRQIDIIDTLFVMSLSSISAINYNPYTESTNESDYIHINNCEFRNCLTSCFFIDAKSGSAETIIVEKTNFMSSSITSSSSVIAFGTNSDSIKLNVKDCLFKNSGQDNNQFSDIYTLKLITTNVPSIESIITIENNTFESDSHNCGPLINLKMPNRDVLIHNCSFIRTRYHENDPYANCIVADRLSKLNISKCIFFECGNDGYGNTDQGNVIGIGKLSDTQDFTVEGIDCYVENCIFNHTSSTISSYSEAVTFIGNTLFKVGKNSLRISASKTRDNKGFVFTDNIITNLNKGVVINSWKYGLIHQPIIRNNTFKHISTVYALYDDPNNEEKIYGFYFTVDGDIPIVFEKNTFRDIRTCRGGFGGYFRQTSATYTNINLTFINCSFEDSTQTNDDNFNYNGGAFLLNNDYNYGNVYLTFSECCFNNNEAKGEGGALYLSSCTKDILIEKCVFDSNKALRNGAVYICNMIESNVIFNECEFNNNYASFGAQAIHGAHSMHQIILKNTLFNDNVNLIGDYNDEN